MLACPLSDNKIGSLGWGLDGVLDSELSVRGTAPNGTFVDAAKPKPLTWHGTRLYSTPWNMERQRSPFPNPRNDFPPPSTTRIYRHRSRRG
jgi:hypothetical protein